MRRRFRRALPCPRRGPVITRYGCVGGRQERPGPVLHALYGVGIDITVTRRRRPVGHPGVFGFGFRARDHVAAPSRPKISTSMRSPGGTLASIARPRSHRGRPSTTCPAAAGGLTPDDRTLSGTVPAINPLAAAVSRGADQAVAARASVATSPPAPSRPTAWTITAATRPAQPATQRRAHLHQRGHFPDGAAA